MITKKTVIQFGPLEVHFKLDFAIDPKFITCS